MDRQDLKYRYLNAFDNAMIGLVSHVHNFQAKPVRKLWEKDDDQVLAFMRGDLLFVFNFSPVNSYNGYGILAPAGCYVPVLSTDDPAFGGFGNIDLTVKHLTQPDPLFEPAGVERLPLYLPARTALVLKKKR